MSTKTVQVGQATHTSHHKASANPCNSDTYTPAILTSKPPRRIGAVLADATENLLRLQTQKR